MDFRIYTKGNYFYIVDNVSEIIFEGLRKDVRVRKQLNTSDEFIFEGVNGFTEQVLFANILKEDGNVYSSIEEFITFYENNTGNFNGGGATPLITSVENGLHLDGTIAKLGGELIEPTEITGSQSLLLGTGVSPLSEFSVQVSSGCGLRRQDETESIFIGFVPNLLNIEYSDLNNITSISYEPNGNGIRIQDDIDNVGLRGATQFTPTNNRDYIQKLYVDSVATGALIPKGTWNSLTNTPTLTSSTSPGGNYLYVVSVASSGVVTLDGESVFNVGDTVFFSVDNGIWYRIGTNFTLQNLQQVTDVGNTTINDMVVALGSISNTIQAGGVIIDEDGIFQGYLNSDSVSFSDTENPLNIRNASYGVGVASIQNATKQTSFTPDYIRFYDLVGDQGFYIYPPLAPDNDTSVVLPNSNELRTLVTSVNNQYADANGNIKTNIFVEEDFFKLAGVAPNHIGAVPYNTAGNITDITSELNYAGIKRLATASTALNSVALLSLSNSTSVPSIAYKNIDSAKFIFRLPSVVGAFYSVGCSQNLAGSPANTIYFRKNNTDTNWQLVAIQGGVSTVVDSGIFATNNVWLNFEIKCTDTEIQYFSNNILIGSVIKTISDSQLLMPYFYVANQVAGIIRNIDMDYFKLTTRFTNR